jgi:DNA-binding CsgD family transcriptional regulator
MVPPSSPASQLSRLLTPREREIMYWVSQGKTNWEVTQILGCVEQKMKKHLQRIYRKLGVEIRMAAANCLRDSAK